MHQFIWCSRQEAEKCNYTSKHVHICITTPRHADVVLSCGCAQLNLSFHDLDPEAIIRSAKALGMPVPTHLIEQCFTKDHARKIIQFVESTQDDSTIIVNCDAGLSRSPGVVLALRQFYGGNTQECYTKAFPNHYIACLLKQELMNRA